MTNHLVRARNINISCPGKNILLFEDDTSGEGISLRKDMSLDVRVSHLLRWSDTLHVNWYQALVLMSYQRIGKHPHNLAVKIRTFAIFSWFRKHCAKHSELTSSNYQKMYANVPLSGFRWPWKKLTKASSWAVRDAQPSVSCSQMITHLQAYGNTLILP